MTDEARKAKNEYMKQWRLKNYEKNKEKVKKYNAEYWQRKSEKLS